MIWGDRPKAAGAHHMNFQTANHARLMDACHCQGTGFASAGPLAAAQTPIDSSAACNVTDSALMAQRLNDTRHPPLIGVNSLFWRTTAARRMQGCWFCALNAAQLSKYVPNLERGFYGAQGNHLPVLAR